ncbi:MAG: bifunctional nuclease family protein [Rhodothermales bacterium]
MDYIPVDIIGLSTSPSSGGAYALVLGEVEGNRRLPIIIGAFEAQAIALELEKIQTPRPMTHDLLRDLFDVVGAEVTDVVVDELREGTFYAKIRYSYGGTDSQLDARPSDAVALAVRVDAQILVAPSVLEEAGIPTEDDGTPMPVSREVSEEAATPKDPLERMKAQLEKAIEEENYERAAQLRDKIDQMQSEQN